LGGTEWLEPGAGLQLQRRGDPRNAEVVSHSLRRAVRQARTGARYPIDEMALLLGVTRDKYEGRGASLMPHNLIVPFCLACRVSVKWLLTGIGPTRSR
jgi:hypothetical protein